MKATAFMHGPVRVHELARAFARGCAVHGVSCTVMNISDFNGLDGADVVWMYGLGDTMSVFKAYEGHALRVVGDVGYFRDQLPKVEQSKRYVRVAINAQQPDRHLRLRPHPVDRFERLGINVSPVERRGGHILVCGYSVAQAGKFGDTYGDWERGIVERLRAVTTRQIVLREKPKNPMLNIPNTARCVEASCANAIRAAWAVVCRSGNIGADCVLHGVPCYAEQGPGVVYGIQELSDIDVAQPLSLDERRAALADLAYWSWTCEEIAQGLLWNNLRSELWR